MALVRANGGNGGSGGTISKLGTVTLASGGSGSVVSTGNLSGIVSANAELFVDFIPVLTIMQASTIGGSAIADNFNWSYDKSTQNLTLTLTGNTSYLRFSEYASTTDIYGLS